MVGLCWEGIGKVVLHTLDGGPVVLIHVPIASFICGTTFPSQRIGKHSILITVQKTLTNATFIFIELDSDCNRPIGSAAVEVTAEDVDVKLTIFSGLHFIPSIYSIWY